MLRHHAALLLCLLLVAPLAGCGGHLAEAPAPGVSLAGAWKLNPTTSDDPQKVIERMRAQALQRIARHEQTAPPPQQSATHHHGGAGAGSATDNQDSAQQEVFDPGHHLDPLRNSQMMRSCDEFPTKFACPTRREISSWRYFDRNVNSGCCHTNRKWQAI